MGAQPVSVFTADTRKRGAASGNTVNIQSGTIGGSEESTLSGGYSEDGASDDNTVTITGGILSSLLSLYGGYSTTASSGNTLNLYTKGNTIENLGYFQTLNFYVPAGTSAGETMLEVTGTADVSNAVIRAGVEDTTKLNPGEVINLIHDANNPIVTDGTTYSMMSGKDTAMDAGFLERKVLIKKQDANTIVLYVPEDSTPALNPDTKLIPESREAAVGALKNAADLISKDAYDAASAAWEDHNVKDHFVPYAVVGGSDMRYETGSHVSVTGLAANVGFVKREKKDGQTPSCHSSNTAGATTPATWMMVQEPMAISTIQEQAYSTAATVKTDSTMRHSSAQAISPVTSKERLTAMTPPTTAALHISPPWQALAKSLPETLTP